MRLVLGIESSCDDTGVALYDGEKGLLAHAVYSQTDVHAEYGGVVPELASRDHIRKLLPLLEQTLAEADIDKRDIDGIAYTAGPGLAGSLLVGAAFARTLGMAWDKPTVAIHHLEGHILAAQLENPKIEWPFLSLLVSGGHTMLIHCHALGHYEILGDTQDDAVGEAFDKVAKSLGLGYPGGKPLSDLALKGQAGRFKLPRPMLHQNTLNFSFSGLKTAVVIQLAKMERTAENEADLAAEFVAAVTEVLTKRCIKALQQTGLKDLVIAGGVSANQQLRASLQEMTQNRDVRLHCPSLALCADNGAMIAYTGFLRLRNGQTEPLSIDIRPRWGLETLSLP